MDGEGAQSTEHVHALTGATVELRCTVTAADGRGAAVRWRRDGVELIAEHRGRFQLTTDDGLDIVDVQLADAGQYTCHVLDQSQRFVVRVTGTTIRQRRNGTRTLNSFLLRPR